MYALPHILRNNAHNARQARVPIETRCNACNPLLWNLLWNLLHFSAESNLECNGTVQTARLIIEYLSDNHTYSITLFTDQRFDIILMFDVEFI